MPCYEPQREWEDVAKLQQRLDEVTEILCELCTDLRARNILMTTDAWVWWQLHEKYDREKADKLFQIHKDWMENGYGEETEDETDDEGEAAAELSSVRR